MRCEPEYGAMGVVGFHYTSVIDALKERKMKKEYRTLLMSVGRLVYLSEEDFQKRQASESLNKLTAEDIAKAFA
jgi:hypothetical protein